MRKLNTQLIRVRSVGRCAFSVLAAQREKWVSVTKCGGVSDLTNIIFNGSLTVFKAIKHGFPRFSPCFERKMGGLSIEYQQLKTIDIRRLC